MWCQLNKWRHFYLTVGIILDDKMKFWENTARKISYETPHEKKPNGDELKKIIESTGHARTVWRSLSYKWHKRFSDVMTNLGDGSWRPLLCDDKYEMPYWWRHERQRSYIKRISSLCDFLKANHLFLQFWLKNLHYFNPQTNRSPSMWKH